MIYKYSVYKKRIENSYEIKIEIDCPFQRDNNDVAINCAKDYYINHGGFLDTWPLDFHLFNENGTFIKSFEVHLEFTPEFSAVEKE